MINLDELIKKCEAATGNWTYPDRWMGKYGITAKPNNSEEFCLLTINGNMPNAINDIKFIAAATPQVVKALCEVVKEYERALDRIRDPEPSHGRPSFRDWELRMMARESLELGKEILKGEK